jgi:hypothetical protein
MLNVLVTVVFVACHTVVYRIYFRLSMRNSLDRSSLLNHSIGRFYSLKISVLLCYNLLNREQAEFHRASNDTMENIDIEFKFKDMKNNELKVL